MLSPSPLIISSFLLLSLPVAFLIAPRILSPKTLPSIPAADEIDDLTLFRRATLSDAATANSSSVSVASAGENPRKIAFLFLTNSDLAFAPLWEKFFSGHENLLNIYIHADPSSAISIPPTTSFRSRFIPSKSTSRSSPSLISAARRLLAAAIVDDPFNSFFALLSQHCIPIRPFPSLHRILVSNAPPISFIEVLAGDPIALRARYVARGDSAMLPEVPFGKFRVGSQFFLLARRHAAAVVADRRLWPKFRLPCLKSREDSCYPEEHYFPTLLSMEDPRGCAGYTLTRVNWTGSVGGHPHMYGPGEVSAALVEELRRRSNASAADHGFVFARKFSPECLAPLMELTDSVILKA